MINKLVSVFVVFFCANFSLNCTISNEMVFISNGTYIPAFRYGNNVDNSFISIKSFYMNKYPISNAEFNNFILNNSEWSVENIKSLFADRNYLSHWKEVHKFEDISEYPVVNVSWFAAQAYCSYIEGRLPTLNEWEYVASASKFKANGKDDPSYLHEILDWYISSQNKTWVLRINMDVNYWGIYGLHGVVWEWIDDFNSVILINTDAEGGGLEEVLYCGAAAVNAIDPADYVAFMRFAFRNSLEANYTVTNLGFRCVKNVE